MVSVSIAAALPAQAASKPTARSGDQRVLRVRVTGFGRRVVATLIDGILLVGFAVLVTTATGFALGEPMPRMKELGPDLLVAGLLDRNPMAVGGIGLLVGVTILYELYCAGIAGQTIGMALVRIRVISGRGRAPGATRGLIRVLAFAVSVLPGGLGWLWAIFDREHRTLHDHLAGTYVIVDQG